MWLATDKVGLAHVVLSGNIAPRLQPIIRSSTNTGPVLGMVKDGRVWIWIGSDHGIEVWNGREWRQIGEQDGLLSNALNEGSMLADPDGTVWFGTGHGLSHLLDASAVFRDAALHPVITDKLLSDKSLNEESIPWSKARLTVSFSSLDDRLGSTIRYRYRLEGLDNDRVETTDNTVRYPALPSGRLVFSVQAFEPTHHLSSVPASFVLVVRPLWWATLWFRLLAFAVSIFVAAVIWRLRIRFLLARGSGGWKSWSTCARRRLPRRTPPCSVMPRVTG